MRRLPINLASEPIEVVRRARRAVAISAAVIAAITLLHLAALSWAFARGDDAVVEVRPTVAPETLAAWQAEVDQLTAVADVFRAREAVAAVEVGNQLVAWRTIPWGAIFAELEAVLPDRVRLEAVQPRIDAAGQVQISMTAAAADSGPLQNLLLAIEASERFREVLPQREDVGQDGVLRMQLWAYYVPEPSVSLDARGEDSDPEGGR